MNLNTLLQQFLNKVTTLLQQDNKITSERSGQENNCRFAEHKVKENSQIEKNRTKKDANKLLRANLEMFETEEPLNSVIKAHIAEQNRTVSHSSSTSTPK